MRNSKKRATTNSRDIPLEIVEEILYNLPVKSLLRFSSVSKSWNSMIFEAGFKKRYAALPERERILVRSRTSTYSYPLSSDVNPTHRKTRFVCPLPGIPYPKASCDQLWCVRAKKSLFLWNPSMRTYRQIPQPISPSSWWWRWSYVYGVGYDSVGDDYKILKIERRQETAEVYSLRSNSWRSLNQPFPDTSSTDLVKSRTCAFVGGSLHWIVRRRQHDEVFIIISLDLSTNKFGEVALPEFDDYDKSPAKVGVKAMRGRLCLWAYFSEKTFFSVWFMEDCGGGGGVQDKFWDKKYMIDCSSSMFKELKIKPSSLRPAYFYDDGQLLIKATFSTSKRARAEGMFPSKKKRRRARLFLYKDCSNTLMEKKDLGVCFHCNYVYVESLVSLL